MRNRSVIAMIMVVFLALSETVLPVHAEDSDSILVSGNLWISDDYGLDDVGRQKVVFLISNCSGEDIVFALKSENICDFSYTGIMSCIRESDIDSFTFNSKTGQLSVVIPSTYTQNQPFYLYITYEGEPAKNKYYDIEYGFKMDATDYDKQTLETDSSAFEIYLDSFDYRNEVAVQVNDHIQFKYDGTRTGREDGLEYYQVLNCTHKSGQLKVEQT